MDSSTSKSMKRDGSEPGHENDVPSPKRSQNGPEIAEVNITAITLTNQLQSPLLRLPGELRNRIYALVLGGMEIYAVEGGSKDIIAVGQPAGTYPTKLRCLRNFLALTAVCRQIHAESALLPYELNSFGQQKGHWTGRRKMPAGSDDPLPLLLSHFTDSQRNAITTISLSRRGMSVIGIDVSNLGETRMAAMPQSKLPLCRQYQPTLRQLPRLNCIILQKHKDDPDYLFLWTEAVRGVDFCIGRKDVEIIFEGAGTRYIWRPKKAE
ncbi:hypothetical protein BU26DRAFT_560846 [Trematosphaeria pertusa]|uniref:Uncharacterized protein n=1 Tax=Trematosphaeria pertusa TaxID=390896 RepID=A0A6A6ISS4_9PLEO|nr:uncharacterized protein BU26DRAFT_560846 [Trematosphaeria pertusa]KAF2253551.1 hypothetical protein BU26DRAFT_560846 [Trematosphaeria pertusa]